MPTAPKILKKYTDIFTLNDANAPWGDFLHLARMQEVPKNYIWSYESEENVFCYLHSGSIRLYCHTFSSRELIVLELNKGCLFREVGLLYVGQRYGIYQQAMTPCVVYNFPAKILEDHDFIRENPQLMINLTNTLGLKLGSILSLLAESIKPNPEVMVSQFLLNFQATANSTDPASKRGITQGELAMSLGLHRSTVCRVLHELREKGVIGKIHRGHMEILDVAYLQNLVKS
ncbi:MAG: Crp/Fnr family transcriptional regulator [Pseudomonadota bacterium]